MIFYLLYAGCGFVGIAISRYVSQLLIVSLLPAINSAFNNSIIQNASPLTTSIFLFATLAITPFGAKLSFAASRKNMEHEISCYFVSSIIFTLIVLLFSSVFFLALAPVLVNLDLRNGSATAKATLYKYFLILYFCTIFWIWCGFITSLFIISGYINLMLLNNVLSTGVCLLASYLFASPRVLNLGIISVPLALLVFILFFGIFFYSIYWYRDVRHLNHFFIRRINWTLHFRKVLLKFFFVFGMASLSRYILQILVGFFVNFFLQFSVMPSRMSGIAAPEVSYVYWLSVFSYFYQIFLLIFIYLVSLGKTQRLFFAISSKWNDVKHFKNNFWFLIKFELAVILFFILVIVIFCPYFLTALGESNNMLKSINGHAYTFYDSLKFTELLIYITTPSLIISAMASLLFVFCQIQGQPIFMVLHGYAFKNFIIIILSAVLLPISILSKKTILIFISWPISDVLAGFIHLGYIYVLFKLINKTKDLHIKVNWNNYKKYLARKREFKIP